MQLPFIPYPQRCKLLDTYASVSRDTFVVLQMPCHEERLVKMAQKLFLNIVLKEGDYALYSADSFAQKYPFVHREGYLLSIREENMWLSAQDARGLFYGMQTLNQWLEMPNPPALEICDWPDLELRSDYLDMRGIFPKVENLISYIEEMARYKLNTLVIEYEDKLPRGRQQYCAPVDCLTREQHRQLLQVAHENYIDVIPLQQTFGHLEYVLKQPDKLHLRATPDTPGEVCPLRSGTYETVSELIDEMIEMHPRSKYIHLGCDEVWSLGQSKECRNSGKTRQQLAIEYINQLAERVLELGRIPIVWDDMLIDRENINNSAINLCELSNLNKNIVVAVWLYTPGEVGGIAPQIIEQLNSLGIKVIPCCAVRAFDGRPNQNYPRIERRLRNIDMWAELISNTRITGMINTNWCSSYALGNPYGLFETSRYTAFYAAEKCWNLKVCSEDYLERFLAVYHGDYDEVIKTGSERRYDYYEVIGSLLPNINRNEKTARLIAIMNVLESASYVNALVFRSRLYSESEVEKTCLREKVRKSLADRKRWEEELADLLPELISPSMAELFMESRKYPDNLFRKEINEILECENM